MMNRYSWILFFLFFGNISLSAQNATLTIGTEKKCAGQEVLLNINGVNLLDVGALTLYIDVDPNTLTFISLENIDPQFEGLSYNYLPDYNRIAMAWSNVVSADFPDLKLFDLKFQVNEGGCPVSFAAGCEIVNSNFQLIDVSYINGALVKGNPTITTQPENVTTTAGKNTSFYVISTDATDYQWETSMDSGSNWDLISDDVIFSGSQSTQLNITATPVSFNQHQFRCVTGSDGCYTTSDIAILNVDSTTAIQDETAVNSFFLKISPNPFGKIITVECNLPGAGVVYIKVLSSAGQEIMNEMKGFRSEGSATYTVNLESLTMGMYICLVELNTPKGTFVNAKKIIKIDN